MKNTIALSVLLTCLISSSALAYNGGEPGPCTPKTTPLPVAIDALKNAMPGRATPEGFCADPYLSICASYEGGSEYREKNFRKFLDEASLRSLEIYAKNRNMTVLAELLRGPDGLKKGLALVDAHPDARSQYDVIRARYVSEHSRSIQRDTVNAYGEKARSYVLKGLETQRQLGAVSKAAAEEMRASINGAKILADFDAASLLQFSVASRESITKAYTYWCGNNGLADNAFQYTIEGQRLVIFCAGEFLRAEGSGHDSVQNFRNIFSAMTHELGHTIDPGPFPKSYDNYLACVAKGDLGTLTSVGGSWQGTAEDIEKQLRTDIAVSHKGEIVADFWAVQAQVAYFNEAPALGAQERFDMIRQDYSAYCSGGDEGIHPAGYYRIAKVLGLDPGIRKALGCAKAAAGAETACGL